MSGKLRSVSGRLVAIIITPKCYDLGGDVPTHDAVGRILLLNRAQVIDAGSPRLRPDMRDRRKRSQRYEVLSDVGAGSVFAHFDDLAEAQDLAKAQSGRIYPWIDDHGQRGVCRAEVWDLKSQPGICLEIWIG